MAISSTTPTWKASWDGHYASQRSARQVEADKFTASLAKMQEARRNKGIVDSRQVAKPASIAIDEMNNDSEPVKPSGKRSRAAVSEPVVEHAAGKKRKVQPLVFSTPWVFEPPRKLSFISYTASTSCSSTTVPVPALAPARRKLQPKSSKVGLDKRAPSRAPTLAATKPTKGTATKLAEGTIGKASKPGLKGRHMVFNARTRRIEPFGLEQQRGEKEERDRCCCCHRCRRY
ncbi:hypothetical protein K505DRAFT_383509, partial [Melanomma pulvis-pyrius CBS 109.77]